jgi:hypothetical protein
MTAVPMSGWLHEQLEQASPDLRRGTLRSFAQAVMKVVAPRARGASARMPVHEADVTSVR